MITKATQNDIPVLTLLINTAYRGETSKQGWTTEAHLLEGKRITATELQEVIENPKNTLLKFTQNNTIVGTVLLTEKDNQLYLGMLTVAPNLQNNGIGKKLLIEAEKHAHTLCLKSIFMTVISVRAELIAWYQRNGYIDTGIREPFPVSELYIPISDIPLEFVFLEKKNAC